MSYNGVAVDGGSAFIPNNGPTSLSLNAGVRDKTIITRGNALVLKISQDFYLGDAQYTVSVDGVQIGGTLTVAAHHGSGLDDTVTVQGDWGGAHNTTAPTGGVDTVQASQGNNSGGSNTIVI